ncbi:Acyl dehydratase [Solimonas aquatica]|uniref:Acyl dehydratase n=1 Tax=Solimonas aquatica TaxID=489703 RepID=A0A1H9G174_9GAMM|nr:MaoC family dehydratase N-terminal domain-containing protein [Solimonas aquatica]SEQ43468.1 Acyl dehydratase [Solimonas aquatica]
MSNTKTSDAAVQLDLSDLDKWVGKPVIFAELWDPCNATDIRRWVMAMDYANPIHWDQEFAARSQFGGIVAPQSFAVAMDYGHGCHPACVGKIPGSHLIFGGEEWWFFGAPIRPGDKLFQKRRFDGYDVKDTSFAGPTIFTRGDTEHRNQNGVLVARERATAIRYLREEAAKRAVYGKEKANPKRWTKEELAEIQKLRYQWILSNREGKSPAYGDVKVGDKLPRRVIGPHTITTFVTEYRAFRQNIWGTWRWNVPEGVYDPAKEDAGFASDMTYDHDARKVDPRMGDGLYHGPSSGHLNLEKAENIAMGGMYGYGASMNAWHVDYVAYWAGHNGFIWHSTTQFRSPAFEGDITYIDGEVVDKQDRSAYGCPVAVVQVKMSTQTGETILKGTAEVQLPY